MTCSDQQALWLCFLEEKDGCEWKRTIGKSTGEMKSLAICRLIKL